MPHARYLELRLDKRPTRLVRLKRDRSKCENTLDKLFLIEWAELLIPTHSVAEIMLRGTVMYLSLFVILRFVMVRQTSTIGIADILVIVVIADAAQKWICQGIQIPYRRYSLGSHDRILESVPQLDQLPIQST